MFYNNNWCIRRLKKILNIGPFTGLPLRQNICFLNINVIIKISHVAIKDDCGEGEPIETHTQGEVCPVLWKNVVKTRWAHRSRRLRSTPLSWAAKHSSITESKPPNFLPCRDSGSPDNF